jgi:hypothetical protein
VELGSRISRKGARRKGFHSCSLSRRLISIWLNRIRFKALGAVLYGQRSFARGNFIVPENHRYHAAYLPHESIRRKRQSTQKRSRLLKEHDGASLRRAKPATRSVKRAAEAKKKTISQAVQKKD